MSVLMEVPALTVMHELMHWTDETMAAGGKRIHDYGEVLPDGSQWLLPGEPTTGYGAWRCWQLNLRGDVDTTLNADSYTWLAMEAWLAWKCPGRPIQDPVA